MTSSGSASPLSVQSSLAIAQQRIQQVKAQGSTTLYLMDLNLGDELPASLYEPIGQLQSVTSVFLCRLGMKIFPTGMIDSLRQLPELCSLYLSGNELATLPKSLALLQNLQVLYLDGNPLTVLPESLALLSQLYTLDISGTAIARIPKILQAKADRGLLTVVRQAPGLTISPPSSQPPRQQQPETITRSVQPQTGGDLASVPPIPEPLPLPPVSDEPVVTERVPKGTTTQLGVDDAAVDFGTTHHPAFSGITAQLQQTAVTPPPYEAEQIAEANAAAQAVQKDWLNVSVFSPPQVQVNNTFLLQVFAYLPEQFSAVAETAQLFDETAKHIGKKSLGVPIARDSQLHFDLAIPGLEVDDPVQSLMWQGFENSVQFGVTVPDEFPPKMLVGTVTVSQASVPIGHLKFRLQVVGEPVVAEPEPAAESAIRYTKAFVSYSSKDREEVLKRVQGLKATGIDVFQDVLELEPGDRWANKLYENIDQCDLFLLFWSTSAKESKWVLKEVEYAMARQGEEGFELPEIKPVILEGPPMVKPPESLKHLHFNDVLLYLMAAS